MEEQVDLFGEEKGMFIKQETFIKKEELSYRNESDKLYKRTASESAAIVQNSNGEDEQLSEDEESDTDSSGASASVLANDKEQTKIRLANKSHEIKAAKEWLEGFPSWLHPKERNIPEVGDWIEDIEAILSYGELPRVIVGFMGPSGCGKSSVINALLDEESLLPCNCSEACTAVAVEVSWNTIKDRNRAYRAKIQFVTAAEWKAELESLVAELLSMEPEARANPATDEGKVAAAKLKTVYPDFALEGVTEESAGQLMNDSVVSKWLGKHIEIEKPVGQGKRFSAEISQYIDSSAGLSSSGGNSRRVAPYWPLVKVVQIFTRSPVLQTGLVLVDLPGSGDSNAAREMVAQGYVQQVSAICIVADIRRALTSAVARNLFGRGAALKRRLLREGILDDEHTFFVLTCTDIINNQQVIRTQGLESLPEVSHILEEQQNKKRRVKFLLDKINECENILKQFKAASNALRRRVGSTQIAESQFNQQAKRRKRDDGGMEHQARDTVSQSANYKREMAKREKYEENCENRIANMHQEAKDIDSELGDLGKQLSIICIRERSGYVTRRMKEDFAAGMRELAEELKEEGDDAADIIKQPSALIIRDGVETFCVCSFAYQILKGRFGLEDPPAGFQTVEETLMPQLMAYCKEFTLNARERLADIFLEDLTRLRRRMRGWADNSTPDKEVTSRQRKLLDKRFTEHLETLEQTVSTGIDFATAELCRNVLNLKKKSQSQAVPSAARSASGVFQKWVDNVLNVRTWKAICKKEGVHLAKQGGETTEHNWNDDLAEELTKRLDGDLGRFASQVLPSLQRNFAAKLGDGMAEFSASLSSSSTSVTKNISNAVQNLMHTLERLQVEAQRDVVGRFTMAVTMTQILDRRVPPAVKSAMKPGYAEANSIKGMGSFRRSRMAIAAHITKVCHSMYADAAVELAEGLDNLVTLLNNNLKKDFDGRVEKIRGDFTKMLNIACSTPRPESGPAKIELQAEVLLKLSAFDGLLGEFKAHNGDRVIIDDLEDPGDMSDEEVEVGGGNDQFNGDEYAFHGVAGMDDFEKFSSSMDDLGYDDSGVGDLDTNADPLFSEENVNLQDMDNRY